VNAALELARETFAFDGLSERQLRSLQSRYGARLSQSPSQRPFSITIETVSKTEFREIDTRGWEYAVDLDWNAAGFALEGLFVRAAVDLDGAAATIRTCVDDEPAFWGVVENVLRPLLACLLLRNGGLLVHSASVQGLLFAGRSGDGKSTIATMALAAGLPVLSDDLNAVRRDGQGFELLPLPFTGDLEEHQLSGTPAPLRAVLALRKAGEDALEPLSAAAATALLVRCAPYVNLDPHRTSLLLDRAAEIAGSAAHATLAFRLGGNPWPILRTL
jgi:hypothetical protein